MTIVTRLVIQRMLLRSIDQGEVLIQPNLKKKKTDGQNTRKLKRQFEKRKRLYLKK